MVEQMDYAKLVVPDSPLALQGSYLSMWSAESTEFTVSASSSADFTISIPNDGMRYFLYCVDIEPWSTPLYFIQVFDGGNRISAGVSNGGYVHFDFNLRYVFLTYGQSFVVRVSNLTTSAQTFGVFCRGFTYASWV